MMRYVKSKMASPENPRILTCDIVLPNKRFESLTSTVTITLSLLIICLIFTEDFPFMQSHGS